MSLHTCVSEVMHFVSTAVSGVLCVLVLMFPAVSDVLMMMSWSRVMDGEAVLSSQSRSDFTLCSESKTAAC